jgi:beta-N-acetylhexosaminidase
VGQLIIGGFADASLPIGYARALVSGRRGGAILFRRNLPSIDAAHALCAALVASCPADLPPLIGVDQEGGRVARLPLPALRLPPMRELAARGDLALVQAAGFAVGCELSALGFNVNFAPVLDVDSEPQNPVIGDRAFSADADEVARHAIAYLHGLKLAGVAGCGKHFPGHGDTRVDSHFALPIVAHPRERLFRVELRPFRAAIGAGVPALMSAHLVCTALDPSAPATLSHAVCTTLLRGEMRFDGVLFSDDLEMKALALRGSPDEVAVEAVRAGCDALLVCSDEAVQELVYEGLCREAEHDRAFRERCCASAERVLALRRAHPPRPIARGEIHERVGGAASVAFTARLALARST